jgi:hypothetical protein
MSILPLRSGKDKTHLGLQAELADGLAVQPGLLRRAGTGELNLSPDPMSVLAFGTDPPL